MLFRVSTCRIRVEYLTRYSANINSGFSCKLDRLGQLCRCVQTSQQRAVGVARGSLRLAREASADASLGPEKVGNSVALKSRQVRLVSGSDQSYN